MKFLLIPLLLVIFSFAFAEERDGMGINLHVENDTKLVGGPGTDRGYTNGARISYIYAPGKIPNWAKFIQHNDSILNRKTKDSVFNFGIGLGHQMFTPEDISQSQLILDDRPYAAWLYLGFIVNFRQAEHLDSIEFDLGLIGPGAQGEFVQKEVHKLINVGLPQGWNNQLKTEPGLVLNYQRRMKFFEIKNKNYKTFDTVPFAGFSLGNITTGLNMGSLFRFGYNIPSDFGPTRPSATDGDPFIDSPGKDTAERPKWGIYGFGGVKGSFVARNIFLDGNTFQPSHRIDKRNFLVEFEGGASARVSNFTLTWRQVARSPEIYTKQYFIAFASLTLAYSADFP